MNAVVKFEQGKPTSLPPALAGLFGDVSASAGDLTTGVISGFPVISYRGKVWRIRKGGEETNYLDDQGDAVQSLNVVLVKSNPHPAKLYYDKPFEEGDVSPPRCWSADGLKPDAAVQEPIAPQCQTCPNNQWGSKINAETGAKGRACSDTRRIAVISEGELAKNGADATKALLRIPPSSLNPLKDYAEKVLKPKGIPYFAVVTRIGFDTQVAYPKLTFRATRFLTEDEARAVLEIQASEDVKRILSESTEFAGATTAAAADAEPIQGQMPAAFAPPAAPTPTQPAPAATPAAAPPQASSPAPTAVQQEVLPAAKPKRGRPPKAPEAPAAAAPVPAQQPAATEASPPAEAPSEFDSMLDQLLGVG